MPLNFHADVLSCSISDVCLTAHKHPTHSHKDAHGNVHKGKTNIIKEVNAIGKYSLSLVGESTGQMVYAIATREALYQSGVLKAHDSPIVAIKCTANSSRECWRLRLESIERQGVEGMVQPKTHPGSSIITLSKRGEVKVWQPVFGCHGGVTMSREEQVFIVFEVSWCIAGMYSVAPKRHLSSIALDPTCLSAIVGYSNHSAVSMYPVPGIIDKEEGQGQISICRSEDWSGEGLHKAGVLSIKVFTSYNDGVMSTVDAQDEAIKEDLVAMYQPTGFFGFFIPLYHHHQQHKTSSC